MGLEWGSQQEAGAQQRGVRLCRALDGGLNGTGFIAPGFEGSTGRGGGEGRPSSQEDHSSELRNLIQQQACTSKVPNLHSTKPLLTSWTGRGGKQRLLYEFAILFFEVSIL